MVTVKVNGKAYGGWKNVNISKSVESICGTFSLDVVNSWADEQSIPQIKAGDLVEVYLINRKGEELRTLTGYVDVETPGFNNNGSFLNISGRDITCDLVDCTLESSYERRELNPVELIKMLIEPFQVKVDGELKPQVIDDIPNSKSLQDYTLVTSLDSKISDEIKKITSVNGFLAYTTANGHLRLTNTSEAITEIFLAEGVNIISASRTYNLSQIHSKIEVFSQINDNDGGTESSNSANEEAGNPDENPKKNANNIALNEFLRYRPLNVVLSESGSEVKTISRVEWIKRVNNAKSREINLEVEGWDTDDGDLYSVNSQITCYAPSIGIDDSLDFIVKQVDFSMSESSGKRTKLKLVHKDAYNVNGDITLLNETNKKTSGVTNSATKANEA